jgi:hypothetical protein
VDYLKKQHDLVKTLVEAGQVFEDFALIKVYIQRSFSQRLWGLPLKPRTFLEVGCGGSLSLHYLSSMGSKAVGVDNSSIGLDYSNYLRECFQSSAEIVRADAFNLPFSNKQFDCVYSIGMVEHYGVEEQLRLCQEMARVARSYLVIGIPNTNAESASHFTVHHGDEDHEPCSLELLVSHLPIHNVVYDGRGIFLQKNGVDKNEDYKKFIVGRFNNLYKEIFERTDLELLISAESQESPEIRRRHGFVEYFIGEIDE